MRIARDSSLREIAFMVCTALDGAGIAAILTGGSAATVHSAGAYQSRDLDFVISFGSGNRDGSQILSDLGYVLRGSTYVHPDNEFTLDFPPGPLSVGRDVLIEWDTLHEGPLLLRILNPTDSCRDRLAGFLFWHDRGSLEQAIAVARAQAARIDIERIREWCRHERRMEEFDQFRRRLR